MTEENGAIRLKLALAFLTVASCIIASPCYSAPTIMQITNTTTTATAQPPKFSNHSTVLHTNSPAKRDNKHEALDQMAEEQRLALQIITTTTDTEDSGDRGTENNNIRPSASTKAHHKEDNNNNSHNGAISFDDQYNHMEAQLKRHQETLNGGGGGGGEKLKRIVINLDSLMSNGSNLPHERGTKLTIGFSPAGVKSETVPRPQSGNHPRQREEGSPRGANNNDRNGDKNSLMMKSTSKKKEASPATPNAKRARSQGNGEASQRQTGGGGSSVAARGPDSMRSSIREAVRKQGGIPTMVMSEIEFGSGGVGGEPRIKFMVNSEAIDMMQNRGANNIQEATRPLQSSESAVISDASLQEAIDTLSGEIESLEKQLDGGGNIDGERDHNDGNIVAIDASSSSNNNRHQLPGHQQHSLVSRELRDQRHTLPASLSASSRLSGENPVGNGYYGQQATTTAFASGSGKAQQGGREEASNTGGQVQGTSDNNENYVIGAGRGEIRASDNNQDENDDDDDGGSGSGRGGGENRERSNESENLESSSLGDKAGSVMGRDSHGHRHQSGEGEENAYSGSGRGHGNNNNNDNNNDDSGIQNYETRAASSSSASSDKLSGGGGGKLESMNNPANSHHRLQAGEQGGDGEPGFTVSQAKPPLLVDNSNNNLFNEQIEPTVAQQHSDYYENKSNDMSGSASVSSDGSAPNPTTNDSSASKKLAKQQKRQQKQQVQQPNNNIESENKMEERVARILDRLKLYTTKDQLMKVARDLQNNYPPNPARGVDSMNDDPSAMKNGGRGTLGGDFGTINQSGGQQAAARGLAPFVKRNHQVSLMEGPLKMPPAHQQRVGGSPWPIEEMLAAAGLMNTNEGEDPAVSMDEMEMARKQISASLQASGVDNIESLLSLASSSSPGRDGPPTEMVRRPSSSSSSSLPSPPPASRESVDIRNNNDGPGYGSTIDERKRMLESGIKLLNEFRVKQMRLKSMEDGHSNNSDNQDADSAGPAAADAHHHRPQQQQQQPPYQVADGDRVDGSQEYDVEGVRQGEMQNSPQYDGNQGGGQGRQEAGGGAYEVTNPRGQHHQQVVIAEPANSGSKEYETTKDLADTMENNERNFEDEQHQRARKSRRYIVGDANGGEYTNSVPDGADTHDDGSEASESNQQETIGTVDHKNEALLRKEGEAELKALEQIIDELVRREKKDKRRRESANKSMA